MPEEALEFREDWLSLRNEPAIDPDRRVIDAHFHFFDESDVFPSYRLPDLQRDTAPHRIDQAIFMQCREHCWTTGPEIRRFAGETEWIDGLAEVASKAPQPSVRIGAIVGDARFSLGAAVRETLEAHLETSSLFRGVRDLGIWDPSPEVDSIEGATGPNLYGEARFREGFAELDRMGLSFDAHQYHSQLTHVADLARAFPDTPIIVNHLGSPLGAGPYVDKREEIFEEWRKAITEMATCPNAYMKLGGLAMPWNGFGWEEGERPPSSDEFVAMYSRYYDHALQSFGPSRCMFESNFPVDRLSLPYSVLWNAFKKIASGYSEAEQDDLFYGTAARVYRVSPTD